MDWIVTILDGNGVPVAAQKKTEVEIIVTAQSGSKERHYETINAGAKVDTQSSPRRSVAAM